MNIPKYILYFTVISFAAVFLTVYDKAAAKRKLRRVPENTLMILGLLGGALAEYIVMRLIHHKTLHRKFMLGLPAEIFLHAVIAVLIVFKLNH